MKTSQNSALDNPILRFFSRFSVLQIVLVALVLFACFSVVWWRGVYTNPERVWNSMLENSLRLNGVTKHVTQSSGGQNVDQVIQLSLGSVNKVQSLTTLTQEGDESLKVVTETIGTPSSDVIRYKSIDTAQTNENGEPLDFSEVVGVWGRNAQEDPGDTATNGELFNESVLGVVPFGELNPDQREELLKMVKDEEIYEIDFARVERTINNGRPRYTYDVAVNAEGYVKLLKRFAEMTGLNHLDTLDPSQYAGSERLSFKIGVDVRSRQLARIDYGDSGRSEELSGYNLVKPVDIPENPLSVEELQQRLQSVQ